MTIFFTMCIKLLDKIRIRFRKGSGFNFLDRSPTELVPKLKFWIRNNKKNMSGFHLKYSEKLNRKNVYNLLSPNLPFCFKKRFIILIGQHVTDSWWCRQDKGLFSLIPIKHLFCSVQTLFSSKFFKIESSSYPNS